MFFFSAGLFSSPHLLEVTERVRLDGKPLSKEAFARYFFEVWDRLQASRSRSTPPAASSEECAAGEPPVEVVEMPGYFQLLTLVGACSSGLYASTAHLLMDVYGVPFSPLLSAFAMFLSMERGRGEMGLGGRLENKKTDCFILRVAVFLHHAHMLA